MKIFKLIILPIFSFALSLPQSFSADFNQTIISNKNTLHYSGKIFYKNKNIVWKYIKPYSKIIWIKDKIYVYEPDLMQVTIMNRKKSLDKLLKNAKKVKQNLYVATYEGKKYYFVFDNRLKKLYYNDDMGNKVEIIFYNYKNNAPTKEFEINFPEEVDVIYQN